MNYNIKKLSFNTFQDKIMLETEVNKENFRFESQLELPIDALNVLINHFQQHFVSLNFYDYIESESISDEVYYCGKFQQLNWALELFTLEILKESKPRKICA